MALKVLVVDDCISIRKMINAVFTREGFEVVEASNAMSGIALLKEVPVDCVICDLYMPEINGISFVQTVKSETANHSLPILMLSCDGSSEFRQRAEQAGAAGWAVKPFNAEVLLEAVRKLIGDAIAV